MWSFLTIHHSLTTFASFCMKTYSIRLLPKQINIKQLHLNSKEIVYLSTQGSEIGLRMMQHLVRRNLFCNDNCNGPDKTREYPVLLVHPRDFIYPFFFQIMLRQIYEYFFTCVIENIMFLRGRKGLIQ